MHSLRLDMSLLVITPISDSRTLDYASSVVSPKKIEREVIARSIPCPSNGKKSKE
jgi:hypothetical protein